MSKNGDEDQGPYQGLVIGLGASAGGLDALDRFFAAIEPLSNCAFVVIQHLAPEHKTMMDTLLSRHTRMPVQVATHDMPLQGGHVYVIPPNSVMTVEEGRLKLVPRAATGVTLPINVFFESLASDAVGRAIGIVLSGTGSDGSAGVVALAGAGAWVMAQDPDTCRFDGMPRSAIATGAVDHVLAPEGLAKEVTGLARNWTGPDNSSLTHARIFAERDGMEQALRLLAGTMRIDFSEYKSKTLLRRIERRMNATGFRGIAAYSDFVASHPEEVLALRHELLIPVSAFFRDREAFNSLSENVLRPLLEEKSAGDPEPLRFWITACSTGEEAYSIAMLTLDLMGEMGLDVPLKIFATDVEPDYVNRAAHGKYLATQMAGLPEGYQERWFQPAGEGVWLVIPRLRQQIVFSRHDLLADAPFTQMDLVSCRNMLIYLRPDAQQRVLRRLSYGLKAGGCLFLGSSETPGELAGDHTTLDNRHRIYRLNRRIQRLSSDDLLSGGDGRRRRALFSDASGEGGKGAQGIQAAVDALMEAYVPPSVLIDADRSVLHMFGDIQRYLRFKGNAPTLDILQLLPKTAAPIVATLLHSAARDKSLQRSRPLPIDWGNGALEETFHVTVRPLDTDSVRVSRLIVSFEPVQRETVHETRILDDEAIVRMSSKHLADLERELEITRANLQDSIQELGTANEELQASNEELMASNEELQSTNEELQSVNEELHTVNAEFQSKICQLNEVNADLESLTRAARIPLVFLDEELCVTRFTPQAVALFQLRPGDIGRPITDLNHILDFPDMYDRVREGLEASASYQTEVADRSGGQWLVTILPYTPRGGRGAKVVMSFIDLSSLKDVRWLQNILNALPENVAVLDTYGVILHTNRAWDDFCLRNGGTLGASGPGVNYLSACRSAAASDAYARQAYEGLSSLLEGRIPHFSLLYPCHSEDDHRWFLLNAAALPGGGCVITHFNMTGWIDPERVDAEGGARGS